jgi:adenine-specific DNA-methyltransferase
MPLSKLRPSFTFTEDRLKELQTIVPEAFADGKINWTTLQEALGEHLEDETQEHFGLTWPGKREARRLAAMPSKGTLVPQPGEGVNEDSTKNIFIEGDNLEVLKLLQKSYAGRVKMIYIDPPYNTGNDFVYPDDYSEPLDAYLRNTGQVDESGRKLTTNTRASGRYHSNWLNMMYPRLILARQLLQDDGVIFISIDDNEAGNLSTVLNEIFGEENFIATFFVQVRYAGKTLVEDADFHKLIEQVFIYSKSSETSLNKKSEKYSFDKFIWKVVEKGQANETLMLGDKKVEFFSLDNYEFVKDEPSEDNLKEIWATGKILDGNSSGRFFRDYLTGRYTDDGYGALYKVYGIGNDKYSFRYFTGPKREGATKGKYYQGVPMNVLENAESVRRTQPIPNHYNFADIFGNCRHEGGVDFRSGKKPIEFLKTLFRLVTNPEENELVLDFFAGSCSTAHAILDLNREDGANRQFIMIQLPEPMEDTEFSTIADLGKERIRRTIKAYNGETNKQLTFDTQDLGFKVCRLDHSNFKDWQLYEGRKPAQLETLFDHFETPLVEGWQKENLLSEILLLQGFPLDSQVIPLEEVNGNQVKRVHSDACAHELFVCLDAKVSDETIEHLHLRAEDILVTLDSALSDETKIRLADQCNLQVI